MRFLIDNALSPFVADRLRQHGHDATHVRDLGLQSADDEKIFMVAKAQDRVLVSADTDFGARCSPSEASPSLQLFCFDAGPTVGPKGRSRSSSRISRRSKTHCSGAAYDPRRIPYPDPPAADRRCRLIASSPIARPLLPRTVLVRKTPRRTRPCENSASA